MAIRKLKVCLAGVAAIFLTSVTTAVYKVGRARGPGGGNVSAQRV